MMVAARQTDYLRLRGEEVLARMGRDKVPLWDSRCCCSPESPPATWARHSAWGFGTACGDSAQWVGLRHSGWGFSILRLSKGRRQSLEVERVDEGWFPPAQGSWARDAI